MVIYKKNPEMLISVTRASKDDVFDCFSDLFLSTVIEFDPHRRTNLSWLDCREFLHHVI